MINRPRFKRLKPGYYTLLQFFNKNVLIYSIRTFYNLLFHKHWLLVKDAAVMAGEVAMEY
jgi:hypothetical protein